MKINSLSLISFVSVLTCASVANASVLADFYVGGMAGIGGQTVFNDGKHTTQSAQVFGAVAGMDLPIFRIEGEYDYFNSSDLKTNAGMLNLYAKIPTPLIMPYIGGGAGVVFGGHNTVNSVEYKVDTSAAYQAMLGATIDILKMPLKFDIEGRALYAPHIYQNTATNTKSDLLEYNVRAKVRFIF